MKRPLLVALTGLLLLAVAGAALTRQTVFVIGGEYTLRPGAVVEGNLTAFFARVTVEQGAHINGKLTSISSELDLRGSVGGEVASIESDVTLGQTCETGGGRSTFDVFDFVILFPEIMRLGTASAG
jgi:hypothetical protein